MSAADERAAARTEVVDAALLLILRSRLGMPDETGATVRGFDEAVAHCAAVLAGPGAFAVDAAHLTRQREWSARVFGPYPRKRGILDHIRKELAEVESAERPDDLGEWIDVVILAIDGAWRAGYEPQEILDAILAKQERNESRTWPDWRGLSEDRAIEHVRGESVTGPTVDITPVPPELRQWMAEQHERGLAHGPMCVCGHNASAHYAAEPHRCLMAMCDCLEFREQYPAQKATPLSQPFRTPEERAEMRRVRGESATVDVPPIESDLWTCVCDHTRVDHEDSNGYTGCLKYTCWCRAFAPKAVEKRDGAGA